MKESLELKTAAEIKIYSDPYRMKIMNTFNKMGRPATSKEVADAMGEVPAKVYYHVKKLESIGLVKVVETREINGIIAKYYEAFQGDIKLKQSDIEPALKKVYLSETQKLIQEMYEQNKQKFLGSIDGKQKTSGFLTIDSLYITAEEAAKLTRDIEALIEPFTAKRKGSGISTHEIFITLINETGQDAEEQKSPSGKQGKSNKSNKPD